MKIILIIVYLVLSVSGLIFMKLGGNPGTLSLKEGTVTLGMSIVSGIGFLCYLGSFLLYTRLVVMFDLSYIVPICAGIVQIAVFIASAMVFKEQLTWQSVVGVAVIIVGIILMNIKKG